jgi:hypothetical protein
MTRNERDKSLVAETLRKTKPQSKPVRWLLYPRPKPNPYQRRY